MQVLGNRRCSSRVPPASGGTAPVDQAERGTRPLPGVSGQRQRRSRLLLLSALRAEGGLSGLPASPALTGLESSAGCPAPLGLSVCVHSLQYVRACLVGGLCYR